ncbi:MAG TPA: gliding motility-associated C-terminal domain-containing protein [Chitinophagales bacterium]|nr:gliding motility-associated C-terminal domain-containing protein [Chitinophagales bacterium]
MKKLSSFLVLSAFVSGAFAQALFNNNGADIYVKDGALMVVKTNSLYNNQIAGAGILDNAGTIIVEGNVTNDGAINAAGDTIRLSGNWVNNGLYAGAASWVDMNGANQDIAGTAVTTFNNLNLGGGAVVKRQQNINAEVNGLLALNDAELATDANQMLVSNTNNSAITRNNGFVSSVGAGRLARATNQPVAYTFPTGSPSYVNAPSIFRPVDYTPASGGANTYGAMVVKGDATADGYSVNTVDDLLCKVNPVFYHRLYQTAGTDAAALAIYFDAAADGNWTDQAHWDSPNRWNYIGAPTTGSGFGLSAISVAGVSDFQPEPFALARKKFTVNAGPDVEINLGESTTFTPTISAATVASYTWTPPTSLTCGDCESPDASPSLTTEYKLTVIDDAGCTVADSLLVTVANPELLIPTGFSPNGDGVNDVFRALNKNLSKYKLQVYNRWGELVFESDNFTDGWDGVYQGVKQPLGVYAWLCEYQFDGATKGKTAKGNVTLVR